MTLRVLITGGSRGIGRALVTGFQQAGHTVATCATTREGAERSLATYAAACDVTDPDQVQAFVDDAARALGGLDVVVNNAGVAGADPDEPGARRAHFARLIDTNLYGTVHVTEAALAHLPDQGRVIQIASVLALRGVPDQTAYCAAKHAVLGYTRALALRLAPRGITANVICPGWVDTDMAHDRAAQMGVSPADLAATVPLGRMATGQDVTGLALFLASSAGAHITGQAWAVDGGATA